MIKINPSILSKTVKVITPKTEKVEEAQIRGTIVYRNQEHFVQLDGAPSNALTPIAEFAEGASDAGFVHGDRVLVLIKNHQAIVTKNLTTGLQAQAAKEASAFTTAITDEGITAQRIIANDTFTNTLRANHITADEIIAGMATIDTLDANYAHITNGVIDNAKIGVADVNDLSANYAHITTGVIDNAKIDVADVNNLSANYAHITNGVIDNAEIGYADVNDLDANFAHITNGVIDNARIGYADVTDLNAHYASINLANVNNAWIESGVIKNGAIADAQIIGVSANKLTAGTIDASNITVTNLNASNITTGSITVDGITIDVENNEASIDGSYIEDGTITMNGFAQEVKDVIDGAIETYTGTVVPTLNNTPANAWTTAKLKDQHIGDVYYVVNSASQQNGYCYRFTKSNNTYSWQLIKDSDVTAALSRLTTAEGKINNIESFDEEMATFKTETEGEISTLQTKTTNFETSLGDKVEKSVFNEVKQTVDENSASITDLSTITTNNGLTKTTNITNTVNTVSQTAAGNSSKISSLTTTLGTNADGTTKTGDIVHRTSDVEQDLSGFKTTVSETYVHGSDSKSGNIVTWENMLIKDVVASIEPIQDLHGYDKPWSGGNGVNKLPCGEAFTQTINGITLTSNGKGIYTLSGTATSEFSYSFSIEEVTLPSTVYVHLMNDKGGSSNSSINLVFYNGTTRIDYLGIVGVNRRYNGTSAMGDKVINKLQIRVESGEAISGTLTFSPMCLTANDVIPFEPYSNICPISGRTEVVMSRCGVNFIKVDGTVWELYNVSRVFWGYSVGSIVNALNRLPAGTYTFSFKEYVDEVNNTSSGTYGVLLRRVVNGVNVDIDARIGRTAVSTPRELSKSVTFTLTESEVGTFGYVYLYTGFPSADVQNKARFYNFQIELGETATSYEQYNGTSYTTALGQTVYGGTLDVVSGLLTVDRVMETFDGSVSTGWNKTANYGSVTRFDYSNSSIMNGSGTQTLCNWLSLGAIGTPNLECFNVHSNYHQLQIQIQTSRLSADTVAGLMSYFGSNSLQVVYKLATPQTYQLTPQEVSALVGWNALWTNCDSVRVDLTGVKDFTDDVSELKITADEISTRVGKTEAHLISMYATSSTAAGTAAKVATITPAIPSGTNWELSTGTTITVKFTNANTTASPTLNVNSKGAKPIKTYANGNLSEAEYKWKAGSTFTFTYNGTNWLMQDSTASVRLTSNETSITQTADSIISLASGNTTYTKPDGTTATSAIGTTVSQTANNVLIKATRSGATDAEKSAGGTSAIGLINVSPDNVVIAAKHVDIAGAAVFNDYSTTQQMNTAIGNAVDDIEVGGRNLWAYGTDLQTSLSGLTNLDNGFSITTEDGIKCAHVTGALTTTRYLMSKTGYVPKPLETFTYSVYVKIKNIVRGTTNPMCEFYFNGQTIDGTWAAVSASSYKTYIDGTFVGTGLGMIGFDRSISDENWHHFVVVGTYVDANFTATLRPSIYLRDCTGDLYIHHVKAERGNKATDWTPAPEEVKAIHALDSAYLSTGATYATILGWCEDGAQHWFDIDTTSTPLTNVKVGDTVRVKYFANNMGANGTIVYLVGTVVEFANNATVKLGSVSLESTVIDGGHILAGTIDTNRLNANTIKSQIVQTTELNADKITSGTISTSRLPSDALKTIRTIERNAGDTYSSIKSWAAIDPCQWTTIVDTTGVRVGDTCRLAIPVTDMSGVTAYITGTVTAVHSKTALTMTGQSISSTTIDGGMILTGKVAASYIDTDHITIGQSQVNNLSTDLNSIKAQYGYTNTTAGTAAKEVVLANYVDRVGAIIGVRFANGNTVSPITLNVNGTGAKTVQSVDPINDLPAATTCNFIRDEFNQWRYLGSDASSWVSKEYASALSSAKQISTYTRSFTKANWDTYGANGHTESWSALSSSGFDNTHISVGDKAYLTGHVSDKAGWHAAVLGTVTSVSTTAVVMTSIKVLYNSAQTEKYITKIDDNGIFVSPSGNSPSASAPQNSVKINANGLYVYSGGVEQAYFTSSGARIGRNVANTSHATILDNGMHIWTGVESTASNEVAFFGATARIGVSDGNRFEIKSDGAYIYNGTTQLGYYGSFTRIGDYNGKNVRIDSGGVKFNTSADNVVATFAATATIGASNSFHINITPSTRLATNWAGIDFYNNTAAHGSIICYNSGSSAALALYGPTNDYYAGGQLRLYSTSLTGYMTDGYNLSGGRLYSYTAYESTISTDNRVAVNSEGAIGRYKSSSRRYKEFIEDSTFDPHGLYNLKARQFKYKDGYFALDDNNPHAYDIEVGFIAEEVEECYPMATVYETDTGEVESWSERKIIPPMLTLIQELNDRVSELERRTTND